MVALLTVNKGTSPTQDLTCKLVAAVQHIPAAAAQAGHRRTPPATGSGDVTVNLAIMKRY